MRKFYLLLVVALLATSSAFADITYVLNGGQPNPYGWNTKDDMLAGFMADGGVTEWTHTIAEFQDMVGTANSTDGLNSKGLCKYLTKDVANAAYAKTEKWGWLVNYVKKVFADAGVTYNESFPHYPVGAFFISGQCTSLSWLPCADFKEAGKDEAYLPAWEYCYAFPTTVTATTTLKKPYREGAWEFAGWYDNAEFTGEPITTIDANTTGTLYAKWDECIAYDLNGGSNIINNPYGWKSKDDMLQAFLTDGGAAECTLTIADFQAMIAEGKSTDGLHSNGLCNDKYLSKSVATAAFANTEKWGWLETYIKGVFTAAGKSYNSASANYAAGAFFISGQSISWPVGPSFAEAGKDEAYFPDWGHSYDELVNPKFPEADVTLYAAEKEGCTFQGWYDNRWFTGEAVTTVDATTKGSTLYAHWSSIMGSENTTLNTLHTHYFDGTYVYASTIGDMGSNKNLYNSNKANEYFSDNNPKGDRKDITLVQEDWVAISGLTAEDVNKEIEAGTAFTKGDNTTFPVIKITTANAKAASTRELNNYRVANFNIYADNAHVNNIWLVAPQAGEYCHLTGYVKAVSGNVVTLAASKEEPDAVEMTVNIAKLSAKSAVVADAWYKFTGIVVKGDKALTFNATSSEDVSTGVEEAEIGSTIVRGMNGEIAVSVASPATVNVYTAGGALVATRNIADSDAIAVAHGFYVVKTDNTVVKVLVK